jgi:RNA polymerase sigma-70 factor (ECF subfamily)
MGAADWQTSTTLLRRLRQSPADEAAWAEFVERYGRLVYGWCRRWGLQEADAEDVTQTVLVELVRQMREFVYDRRGSFRGWLRTVAQRTWGRFLEARRRAAATGQDGVLGEAAGDDLHARLEAESDREVLELAMRRVRDRVYPRTWEAFRLLALEHRSGAEAAGQLGMTVGAVFVARSKVQKMLREEVERLSGE